MSTASELLGVSRVWIIEKDSGVTLFSYEPTSTISSSLFGGLLTAIRNMMSEIQIGQLSSISTDTHDLTVTVSEHLIATIILDKGFSTECLYPLLIQINKEAESMYRDMMETCGYIETDFFSPLKKTLIEMINVHVKHLSGRCEDFEQEAKPKKVGGADKKLEEAGLW